MSKCKLNKYYSTKAEEIDNNEGSNNVIFNELEEILNNINPSNGTEITSFYLKLKVIIKI